MDIIDALTRSRCHERRLNKHVCVCVCVCVDRLCLSDLLSPRECPRSTEESARTEDTAWGKSARPCLAGARWAPSQDGRPMTMRFIKDCRFASSARPRSNELRCRCGRPSSDSTIPPYQLRELAIGIR